MKVATTDMTMTELCDHIEQTHHVFLRAELPRLHALIDDVVGKHMEQFSWLDQLRATFLELEAELEPHMMKEEQILFPMIREMERESGSTERQLLVESPISVMESEHDRASSALERLRLVTDGFRVPTGGGAPFQDMMDGLRALEADMHEHIHTENDVLFVRALRAQDPR